MLCIYSKPGDDALSVIPAKAGIQYYSFLVPGFRREDEEVTHYLFLDLPPIP